MVYMLDRRNPKSLSLQHELTALQAPNLQKQQSSQQESGLRSFQESLTSAPSARNHRAVSQTRLSSFLGLL